MGLIIQYTIGQTPLDEEENEGLRIKSISNRHELNEFEQHNIEKAMLWLKSKRIDAEELLSEKFVKELHRRMYGDVWKWAGLFRKTNKNLGVDKHIIPQSLKQLLDDSRYWIQQRSFSADEIAIRVKHRIVQVHCFANGNGRHSRLIADAMMEKIFNQQPFTWGAAGTKAPPHLRTAYIKALQKADAGNYSALVAFAKC